MLRSLLSAVSAVVVIFLAPLTVGFAQNPFKANPPVVKDSNLVQLNDDDLDMLFELELGFMFGGTRPTVEFNYQLGAPKHPDVGQSFHGIGQMDLRFGSTTEGRAIRKTNVHRFKNNYIHIGWGSANSNISSNSGANLNTDMLRFGIGERAGYGYKLGEVSITPYYGDGLTWTRLAWDTSSYAPDLRAVTALYHDAFRVTNLTEVGLMFNVTKNIGINVGYEQSLLWSRFVFWQWLGSEIVEGVGQGLTKEFIKSVGRNAPEALPFLNALLRGGVAYGFNQLRYNNQFWPFDSAPAMLINSMRVGVTFTF